MNYFELFKLQSAQGSSTQTPNLSTPLTSSSSGTNNNIQIMQQIVTPSGEVQHIPVLQFYMPK